MPSEGQAGREDGEEETVSQKHLWNLEFSCLWLPSYGGHKIRVNLGRPEWVSLPCK